MGHRIRHLSGPLQRPRDATHQGHTKECGKQHPEGDRANHDPADGAKPLHGSVVLVPGFLLGQGQQRTHVAAYGVVQVVELAHHQHPRRGHVGVLQRCQRGGQPLFHDLLALLANGLDVLLPLGAHGGGQQSLPGLVALADVGLCLFNGLGHFLRCWRQQRVGYQLPIAGGQVAKVGHRPLGLHAVLVHRLHRRVGPGDAKQADGPQRHEQGREHAHQHQQSREYLEISHARSLLPFVSLNIQNTVRGTPVWLGTAPKAVDFRVNRGVFFGRVRLPFRHPCGAPEGCFARIASPRTLGPGGDGILAALTG